MLLLTQISATLYFQQQTEDSNIRETRKKAIDIYCRKDIKKNTRISNGPVLILAAPIRASSSWPRNPPARLTQPLLPVLLTPSPPLRLGFMVLFVLFIVPVLFEWASRIVWISKATSVFSSTRFNFFYFLKLDNPTPCNGVKIRSKRLIQLEIT
jgi:hypothetical protein